MAAMVASVNPLEQTSFAEHLGSWRSHDLLGEPLLDMATSAFFPPMTTPKGRISSLKLHLVTEQHIKPSSSLKAMPVFIPVPQSSPPPVSQSPALPARLSVSTTRSNDHKAGTTSSSASSSKSTSSAGSSPDAGEPSQPKKPLSFTSKTSSTSSTPERCLKRRRPLSDVDGPNTASLGCKKRRLRLDLVTSRLSQPFSLPATHILNREAVAVGDKRFLKLAAILAARKLTASLATLSISSQASGEQQAHAPPPPPPHNLHPAQNDILRRAAVLNRFRLRVGAQAAQRGDQAVVEVAAGLTQFGGGVGGFVANAQMPGSGSSALHPVPATPALGRLPPALVHAAHYPHPLARASPPGSPIKALRPAESPGFRLPPSPQLRPVRSPELQATRGRAIMAEAEPEEEEGMAFPSSEHESRYDDEPDDVYADFSVIFGGGNHSDDEEEDYRYGTGSEEGLEDVLDDLDGIPWGAR